MASSAFARLPKVDLVLDAEPLRTLPWRREIKRRAVQQAIDELRNKLRDDQSTGVPDAESLAATIRGRLDTLAAPRPLRVLNATGVILHTNIGRAPLSREAVEAMAAAAGYCDLEVVLDDGRRGSRFAWLRPFVQLVVGAEDVHVVNNNAAALLLACTALGQDGGVALSQGQMVEIGDGFRVTTMAAAGGCRVVPVGSTNRTHRGDYEQALTGPDPVAALLWVHQSNFEQSGFVSEVGLRDLAELARAHDVPLIADLGSGSLGGGLPDREPTIGEYIEQGADLVLASGDKLLGGPQGGVIAGRADLVHRCRRFPMARALRPDKTALAALHATFAAHALEGTPALPLHQMFAATVDSLRVRAAALIADLGWGESAIVEAKATIGGGSLPGDTIESLAIAVPTKKPTRIARRLRIGDPPVIGRIEDDRLLLDLRTVEPVDDKELARAIRSVIDA